MASSMLQFIIWILIAAINIDIGTCLAVRGSEKLWDNGIIPYEYDSKFTKPERRALAMAVLDFNRYTCIKWVPRSHEMDYVKFAKPTRPGGCSSYVGKIGGKQELNLGSQCFRPGRILHEMMHAVGLFHENARPDRDDYISIQMNNVISDRYKLNFAKYSLGKMDTLGTPYDCNSITHSPDNAYAKSRDLKTIVPIAEGCENIGKATKLSPLDIKDVGTLYGC